MVQLSTSLHKPISKESMQNVLECLLQSPSKQFVEQLFVRIYQCRLEGISDTLIQQVSQALFASEEEEDNAQEAKKTQVSKEEIGKCRRCLETIQQIMEQCVFFQIETEEEIFDLIFKRSKLNTSNDEVLKMVKLMCQVLLKYGPTQQQTAMNHMISLPKLVDLKWRVDLKSSASSKSNASTATTTPCVMVQMTIDQPSSNIHQLQQPKVINFEMNRETLEVMLSGLSKIRDQLSGMNQTSQ